MRLETTGTPGWTPGSHSRSAGSPPTSRRTPMTRWSTVRSNVSWCDAPRRLERGLGDRHASPRAEECPRRHARGRALNTRRPPARPASTRSVRAPQVWTRRPLGLSTAIACHVNPAQHGSALTMRCLCSVSRVRAECDPPANGEVIRPPVAAWNRDHGWSSDVSRETSSPRRHVIGASCREHSSSVVAGSRGRSSAPAPPTGPLRARSPRRAPDPTGPGPGGPPRVQLQPSGPSSR